MTFAAEIAPVLQLFPVPGEFVSACAYGAGHINDSYRAAFRSRGSACSFLLQRINTRIFADPHALMQNIERVTAHIETTLDGVKDRTRRVLRFVRGVDGRTLQQDSLGGWWRMMHFIDGTSAMEEIASPSQAYQVALAFGRFQRQLTTLPSPPLIEILPGFHDTPMRFAQFETSVEEDIANRASRAQKEIAFALARKQLASALLEANLPRRTTHNDTKCNNVLLDDQTGEGVCVIDLDTVMPGLAPYDFGDMVRSMANPAAEDERDLTRVHLRFDIFEAIARGYLDSASAFLTQAEKSSLPLGGKLITFEQGIRFLADYLRGDTYYKTSRDEQNLDRCRMQFKLVESIEREEDRMNRSIEALG